MTAFSHHPVKHFFIRFTTNTLINVFGKKYCETYNCFIPLVTTILFFHFQNEYYMTRAQSRRMIFPTGLLRLNKSHKKQSAKAKDCEQLGHL